MSSISGLGDLNDYRGNLVLLSETETVQMVQVEAISSFLSLLWGGVTHS